MTFEQLRVLHAIVTEGTFRRAAQTLFKTQPALSNMMKKLEQEVGFEILSRHQYRPSLTAEGQVFYEKALLILNQMAQLSTLSRRITRYCQVDQRWQNEDVVITHFPVQQAHVTCCHVSNDRLLSNR